MICRSARVVRLNEQDAVVAVKPRQACPECEQGRGCGLALFAGWFGRGDIEITTRRRAHWTVGQQVDLEVEPGTVAHSATLTYGLPLFTLMAGIAIGQWLGSDLTAAAAGAGGLVAGLLLAARWGRTPRIRIDGEL